MGGSKGYAFLARDDALPDHEVGGPIRQRLRLRHESLKRSEGFLFKKGDEVVCTRT
jgi:hypothetical protein